MDAFALLKADHERIDHLIARLEVTTERSDKYRAGLLDQLQQEIVLQLQVEEEALYPALTEYKQTRSLSFEVREEAKALRLLLEELASVPVHSKEWAARFGVFRESLRLHMVEKERDLFPKARRAFSPEEWEDLAVLLEGARLRHPVHASRLTAV